MSAEADTRFKVWWRLVGSAVENAARMFPQPDEAGQDDKSQPAKPFAFKDLFLRQEEDDEESASLTDALAALAAQWPDAQTFTAGELAKVVNDQSEYRKSDEVERSATLRDFLFPTLPAGHIASAKAIGNRLKSRLGEPAQRGNQTLILRGAMDTNKKQMNYHIEVRE
jgi:hypothetical protein